MTTPSAGTVYAARKLAEHCPTSVQDAHDIAEWLWPLADAETVTQIVALWKSQTTPEKAVSAPAIVVTPIG